MIYNSISDEIPAYIQLAGSPIVVNYHLPPVSVRDSGHQVKIGFKRKLWEANGGKCCYCGVSIGSHKDVNIDHMIAVSKGGNHHHTNLACACRYCNTLKGTESVRYLKLVIALDKSPLRKIISPSQAVKLLNAGIELGLDIQPLYFETQGGEK